MKVIGFTGYAQSGKDTAAQFLVEQGYEQLSFADALRNAVYALNPIIMAETSWEDDCYPDGSPCAVVDRYVRVQEIVDKFGYELAKSRYPEYRALLQRMGTEVGRDQFGINFWVDRVTAQMKSDGNYVVSDVRFPNEVAAVKGCGGKVFRVVRPGVESVNTHVSDTGIDSLKIDGVVPNASTLTAFRSAVLEVAGIV